MTDQRDKLIEEIMEEITYWVNFQLNDFSDEAYDDIKAIIKDINYILHTHLSDKLILDRKQVEEMIENASDSADLYWKAILVKDLNSLLTNQANDGE